MRHLKNLLHPGVFEMVVIGLIVLVAIGLTIRFRPRRLKQNYFVERWKKLQLYCRKKNTWPKAITEADKLLQRALRLKKYKGRSMGEKMVNAQHTFTDNDSVWYAHSLYKKIVEKKLRSLKQSEIKDALVGYRQALRDLGALPSDESN